MHSRARPGLHALSMGGAEVFHRQQGAEGSRLEGELVVLDAEGKMVRALNGTAARVWELLDGQHSVDEVCRVLEEEFEVEPAQLRRDVEGFLSELRRSGLVVRT